MAVSLVDQWLAGAPALPDVLQAHLVSTPERARALCAHHELSEAAWAGLWEQRASLGAEAVTALVSRPLTESQQKCVLSGGLRVGDVVACGRYNTFSVEAARVLVGSRVPSGVAESLLDSQYPDAPIHREVGESYPPIQRLIAVAWGAGDYTDDEVVSLCIEASSNHSFSHHDGARRAVSRLLYLRPHLVGVLASRARVAGLPIALAECVARSRNLVEYDDQLALVELAEKGEGARTARSRYARREGVSALLLANPRLAPDLVARLGKRGHLRSSLAVSLGCVVGPYAELESAQLAKVISYERAVFRRRRSLAASHPEVFYDLACNEHLSKKTAGMVCDALEGLVEYLDVRQVNRTRKELGQRFGLVAKPVSRMRSVKWSLMQVAGCGWTTETIEAAGLESFRYNPRDVGNYVIAALGEDIRAWDLLLALLETEIANATVAQVVAGAQRLARAASSAREPVLVSAG